MKKIFFILILTIATITVKAQTSGVPDTLAYLQNIVANKAQYIGQPFSTLNNNLQIQIKFFSPFAAIHYAKDKETSTSFAFYYSLTDDDHYLTYPRLRISWQQPLNINQSNSLWKSNNLGGWATAVYNFYKNAIIKDITVLD